MFYEVLDYWESFNYFPNQYLVDCDGVIQAIIQKIRTGNKIIDFKIQYFHYFQLLLLSTLEIEVI